MNAAEQLISDYRATWEDVIRGDAGIETLGRFFNVPCFMVSLDGSMQLYASEVEITAFNQTRLDAFQQGGVHNASLRAVDVMIQGSHLSLCIVNWELTRKDGTLERAWRHYYTIIDRGEDASPTIVISAFQTGS